MEETPSQGQSPPPPNSPSLPTLSDGIWKFPSCRRAITVQPGTRTEDHCHILPSCCWSGTATTAPWSRSLRLTSTFPRIIRQKPTQMKTATAIMTTTREKLAKYNWQKGGGLPGWGIWGGHCSSSDAALGLLPIGQRGGGCKSVEGGNQSDIRAS